MEVAFFASEKILAQDVEKKCFSRVPLSPFVDYNRKRRRREGETGKSGRTRFGVISVRSGKWNGTTHSHTIGMQNNKRTLCIFCDDQFVFFFSLDSISILILFAYTRTRFISFASVTHQNRKEEEAEEESSW